MSDSLFHGYLLATWENQAMNTITTAAIIAVIGMSSAIGIADENPIILTDAYLDGISAGAQAITAAGQGGGPHVITWHGSAGGPHIIISPDAGGGLHVKKIVSRVGMKLIIGPLGPHT